MNKKLSEEVYKLVLELRNELQAEGNDNRAEDADAILRIGWPDGIRTENENDN